jgi:RNase P/RNase MRP subunit p29
MKFTRLIPAIVVAYLCGTAADAHHSFAGTYREGETVDDEGNTVLWGGEWGSVSVLSQGGVDRFTLKAGEHIIIDGAPPRDTMDRKVLVQRVVRPATRTADEFKWEGRFQ